MLLKLKGLLLGKKLDPPHIKENADASTGAVF